MGRVGTGWGGWRGWVRVGAKDFSPLHGWVRWVLRVPWLLEGAGGSRFRRALLVSGCPCAGVGSWGRFALRFPPSTGSGQAQDERTGWGQVRQGARGTGWGGWRGWVRVGAKDFSPLHGWVRWVLRVPWLLEGAGGSRFRRALLVSGCPCAGVGSWGRFALRFPPSTGSGQARRAHGQPGPRLGNGRRRRGWGARFPPARE